MHFFLSTLFPFLPNSLIQYWNNTNQAVAQNFTVFPDFQVSSWHDVTLDDQNGRYCFSSDNKRLVSVCSSNSQLNTSDYCSTLLDHYDNNALNSYFDLQTSFPSCIIADIDLKLIFLFSDTVQTLPLWYWMGWDESKNSSDLFITTDLFVALQYELYELNVVPRNHYLTIDFASNRILDIGLLREFRTLPVNAFNSDFASNVLEIATRAIQSSLDAVSFDKKQDEVIVEFDRLLWSSKLLDYAADRISLTRKVWEMRPSVSVQLPSISIDSPMRQFAGFVDLLQAYDLRQGKRDG